MQRGPILDGLPAWYVRSQLRKFRDGVRGTNAENRSEILMGAGQSILHDDGEIARVSDYIASLPPAVHLRTIRQGGPGGAVLYLSCGACHGTRAEGRPELKAPPLNVQEDWYLLDQLRKFQSGLRGSHPEDGEGSLMRAAAAALQPEQMRDVIFHITRHFSATNAAAAGSLENSTK